MTVNTFFRIFLFFTFFWILKKYFVKERSRLGHYNKNAHFCLQQHGFAKKK
jgi:hypothetical protein